MKKRTKKIALVLVIVFIVTCLPLCLTACSIFDKYNSERLNMIAEEYPILLLGDNVLNWNVFAVDPKNSFGVDTASEPSWYSYRESTQEEINALYNNFCLIDAEFQKVKYNRLKGSERTLYRYLDNSLLSYLLYYGSSYALDFDLIGGAYIDSQGGYVASFSDSVENFTFRSEKDVKDLLSITRSTRTAFITYLDYLEDREDKNYPLFDETITSMQEYLNSIVEKGNSYYLYDLVKNKIKNANFLSESSKTLYISQYTDALTNNFMSGVKILAEGLNKYKGHYNKNEVSYLAAYGNVGAAYYEWLFFDRTGIQNLNFQAIYTKLLDIIDESANKLDEIDARIDAMTNADVKADFEAYRKEEKALLGLTTPETMLTYLETASKSIIPDLKSQPEIDFKYMDETVSEISTAMAYYLKSPIDQKDSVEHITLNPHYLEGQPTTMLTTIAHEGYPGHLYAYVNEKETYAKLLMIMSSTITFSEGWANYTELAILDHIAATSNDEAVKLYCEYYSYNTILSYANMALIDIQFNYLGTSMKDYISEDDTEEQIADLKNALKNIMENPTMYIPYGYGLTVMVDVHNMAKDALGSKYNEVDFNGALLSEGMGPTITRAYEITDEYIKNNR